MTPAVSLSVPMTTLGGFADGFHQSQIIAGISLMDQNLTKTFIFRGSIMTQSVTFKAKHSTVATAIVILVLSVIAASCSKQHPYHEAVGLIKEKKYDEAKELLKTVPMGDSLATKAAVGILVCEVGSLYQKKNFEPAYNIIDTTGNRDGRRYYLLNISPTDPLFPHAATLAHLVAGEVVIKEASDYNASFEGNLEEYGADSEIMSFWIRSVKTGMSASYRECDFVEEGQDDSPPFIRSIGLPNLPRAEEWKTEVDVLVKKFAELETKTNEMVGLSNSSRLQREEADMLATLSFSNKDDAISWLTDGYWATPIIDHPEHGRVRVFSAFSRQGVASTGLINAATQYSFNVERETCRFGTVEGTEISIIMSGGNSAVIKTGDNSCKIDGMPMDRFR